MIITLAVKGLGHVPSFKNNKLLARGRLITDPAKQRWMQRCIRSFASQLRSLCQTTGAVTQTGCCPQSLIASLPQDDSWQWITELTVTTHRAEKGSEGAVVTIERVG